MGNVQYYYRCALLLHYLFYPHTTSHKHEIALTRSQTLEFSMVDHVWIYCVLALSLLYSSVCIAANVVYTIPTSAPSNSITVDQSLVSVSIEFFAFPGYAGLTTTSRCLQNIEEIRGAPPAVRIGGTTQYGNPKYFMQVPINAMIFFPLGTVPFTTHRSPLPSATQCPTLAQHPMH